MLTAKRKTFYEENQQVRLLSLVCGCLSWLAPTYSPAFTGPPVPLTHSNHRWCPHTPCSPRSLPQGPCMYFPLRGMHSGPLSLVKLFHLSDLQTSLPWLLGLDYRLSWFRTPPLLSFHQSYHLTSLYMICICLASSDILSVWNIMRVQ